MKNILVVDDEKSILKFVSEALNSEYNVLTTENVPDAEDILKTDDIDLVILDIVMPQKNGIDMIMEIKKLKPDMKIIAISGGGGISGRFDYLPVAKLIGAAITLRKPFSVSELRNEVRTLIEA
jgi:DNA-binding response OmpR family regulator